MKRNMIVVYRSGVSNVGLMSTERNSYTDKSDKALPTTYLPTYLPTYLTYIPTYIPK
jgi:hypothetical protein